MDDKKYSLYNSLRLLSWVNTPDTFDEFTKRLDDSEYRQSVYNFGKSANLISTTDKTPEEFSNWLGVDAKLVGETLTTQDDPYKTRRVIESAVESIAEGAIDFFAGMGAYIGEKATAEFDALFGDYKGKIDILKKEGQFAELAVTGLASIPDYFMIAGAEAASVEEKKQTYGRMLFEDKNQREESLQNIQDIDKRKTAVQQKFLESFIKNRKEIKDWFVERGLSEYEPSMAGQFFSGLGFTTTIMGLSLIPGVGIGMGFGYGMSVEAMNLAGDIYEETGDIDKARVGYVTGSFAGATEMFTPLETLSFVKRGIARNIRRNVQDGVLKELGIRSTSSLIGRQAGRQFAIESTQEISQTVIEQGTKLFVDVPGAEWDFKEMTIAGLIGGFTGMLFGIGSGTAQLTQIREAIEAYANRPADKKEKGKASLEADLDRYVKLNTITEKQKTEIMDHIKSFVSDPDAFTASMNKQLRELENEALATNKAYAEAVKTYDKIAPLFDKQTSPQDIMKAKEIAEHYIANGIPLNNLDVFLMGKGLDVDEYGGIENLNLVTDLILNEITNTKDFIEVKDKIAEEQGLKGEELIERTHSEILNNPLYSNKTDVYKNFLASYLQLGQIAKQLRESEIVSTSYVSDTQEQVFQMAGKFSTLKMDDFQLADYINKKEGKFESEGQTSNLKLAVMNYNNRMKKQGREERKKYELVKKGEKLSYKITSYMEGDRVKEETAEDHNQLKMFQMEGIENISLEDYQNLTKKLLDLQEMGEIDIPIAEFINKANLVPDKDKIKIDFQEILNISPRAKEVLERIGANDKIHLSGSLALALKGAIYRKAGIPIHDLDFRTTMTADELNAYMKEVFPEAIRTKQIVFNEGTDQSKTFLQFLVPYNMQTRKNERGEIVEIKKQGKAGEYITLDFFLTDKSDAFLHSFEGKTKAEIYVARPYLTLAAKVGIKPQRQKDIDDIIKYFLEGGTLRQEGVKPVVSYPEVKTPAEVQISPSEVPIAAREAVKRLEEKGANNPAIKLLTDWLLSQVGNVEIIKDGSIKARGEFRWHPVKGQKIFVNPNHQDNKSLTDVYNTIAHELFHAKTHQVLDGDSVFNKQVREIFESAKKAILGTEFYENNKNDLDRVFNTGRDVELHEFLDWSMTGTDSALYGWVRENNIAPDTPYLKALLQRIFDALLRFFNKSANKLTYAQAIETVLNQKYGMPTETIEAFGEAIFPGTEKTDYNVGDVVDKALALSDEVLTDMRGMTAFIDSLELDIGKDPYAYIQSLNRKQFDDLVNRSPRLLKKMEIYHSKYYPDMEFADYKRTATVYAYLNIKNVTKRKAALLDLSGAEPKVTYVEGNYKDFKGSQRSTYSANTMLDKALPKIEEVLGVKLELVYLEDIKTDDKTGKPGDFLFKIGNNRLKKIYAKAGILFPGTWADKSTAIGFRITEGKITPEVWQGLKTLYDGRIAELVQSGEVNSEYAFDNFGKEGLTLTDKSSLLRTLLEDFRRGGKLVNGQLQSIMFTPGKPDTYDGIKIFKRPYLTAPMFEIEQLPEEVKYIVDKVVKEEFGGDQKRSGIVVRNNQIYQRMVIVNDNPQPGSMITLNDKTYDLHKILVNEYGTPVLDGSTLLRINASGQIYRYMAGISKTGALKFWAGNNLEGEFDTPFFLKTAGHEFSKEDNIIKWMEENNLAGILPASSVKVNDYGVNDFNPSTGNVYEDMVIEVPLQNFYRIQEKETAKELAKGLQQLLTTNFMVPGNTNLTRAEEWMDLMREFTDNLINRFNQDTRAIDPEHLVNYIKDIITSPSGDFQRGVSDLLSQLLINDADRILDEYTEAMADFQNENNEEPLNKGLYKELLRQAQADARLNNHSLGEKVADLFYHPYFSKIFNDYIHQITKDLIFYEIPSNYAVIAPDLGWLTQTRVKLASDYALELAKSELAKENNQARKVIEGFEAESKILQEELEGIQSAEEAAAKAENADLAVELKARADEIVKEIDEIAGKIEKEEEGILNIDGRNPEVQARRDKILYGWINEETGRIKGDYNYISADVAKKRRLKLGDSMITNFVPSDSAQSTTGSTVIGIMPKSISEDNKVVGWSEYYQSQAGKDFDLDTVLVIAYTKLFGDRVKFQKLADIFRETKNNYPQYILNTIRRVLNDNSLTLKDIYSKEVRLRYMQAIGEVVKAPDTYNPLYNQDLLDRYAKEIGIPVNKRKTATFKSAVNFKTKFSIFDMPFEIDFAQIDLSRQHTAHLIETNAKVDLPNDDTALKYSLSPEADYDLNNGTNIREVIAGLIRADQSKAGMYQATVPKYIQMLSDIDNFLFGYGIKISTKDNLDNRDDSRSMKETAFYINDQIRKNNLLQSKEGKAQLIQEYKTRFRQKHPFMSDGFYYHLMRTASQYISNIEISTPENSMSMYLVEQVDFNNVPDISLNNKEYLTIEHQTVRTLLERYYPDIFKRLGEIYGKEKAYVDARAIETVKDAGISLKDARLGKLLFLLTRSNPQLHLLKGKVLRIINMFIKPESLFVPQHNTTRMEKDLSVLVDEAIFPDIVEFTLNKDLVIHDRIETTLTGKGDTKLILKPVGSQIEFTFNGQKILSKDLKVLSEAGDNLAKSVLQFIREELGGEKAKHKSDNRRDISRVIDFSRTLDLNERYMLIDQLVSGEYYALNPNDKETLLLSLSAFVPGANESLYTRSRDHSYNNNRFFVLLNYLKDPVTRKVFERYATSFKDAVPYPGLTNTYNVANALEESEADWKVFNMLGISKVAEIGMKLPKTEWQSNIVDYVIREKVKPYTDRNQNVTKVVDLTSGSVVELNNADIRDIVNLDPTDKNIDVAIGDVQILYGTLRANDASIGKIRSSYQLKNQHISNLENDYVTSKGKEETNPLKAEELVLLRQRVAEIIENNNKPDGFNLAIREENGRYIYSRHNVDYTNIKDMLDEAGIESKDRIPYEIAVRRQEIYSVDNIKYIDSMISYLGSMALNHIGDGMTTRSLVSMMKRYRQYRDRMLGRRFEYYPRVYKEEVFQGEIMNYLKGLEADRIRQSIREARQVVDDNAQANRPTPDSIRQLADRENDDQWILTQAIERVSRDQYNIKIGTFDGYVNAFGLKRELPDAIDGRKLYDTSTLIPHERHRSAMIKMLERDLSLVAYLQYRHNAVVNGIKKKEIDKIQRQIATVYGHRNLLSREISTNQIAPGMEVSFYDDKGRFVSGVVDRTDERGYVYMKMDADAFRRQLQNKIAEYNQMDLDIQRSSFYDNEPSARQLAVLDDLFQQGYLQAHQFMGITKSEASRLINTTLREILNNPANWGRYHKSDMFKQFPMPDGSIQNKPGAYRFLEFGSVERLRGIARELNNTYDGQLYPMAFGDAVKAGNLVGYLEYATLGRLPDSLTGLIAYGLARFGISTPGGGMQNIYDGISSVIRDRGFFGMNLKGDPTGGFVSSYGDTRSIMKELKLAIEENNLQKFEAGLEKVWDQQQQQEVFQNKREAVKAISVETMLENMLIYNDYFTSSILNNFDELFGKDDKTKIEYTLAEKVYQIRKTVRDSWGYKEYRETIKKLNEKRFNSTNPDEINRLTVLIRQTEESWKNLHTEKMNDLLSNEKYRRKLLSDSELANVNIAEINNMTSDEMMGLMWNAVSKGRPGKIANYLIGMETFKAAEGWLRRMAIVSYASYEINIKGETDIEKIKIAAMKGVARSQALYDQLHRRLGDRTQIGRIALMFGQYPYFMRQNLERRIWQAKGEGKSKEAIRKIEKEYVRDLVMSGFSFFIPGLRVGSPVNLTANALFLFMLNALKRWSDGEDPWDLADWDTMELMQALLSFKIGMGIGIPLSFLWNELTGADRIFTFGRIGRAINITYELLLGKEEGRRKTSKAYEQIRWWRQVSRFAIGINPWFPPAHPDMNKRLQEHYKKDPGDRILDMLTVPIPGYSHLKYGTEIEIGF